MSTSPRVALVTGAAVGIGRGIALRLAEDGFDIGVNDIASKQAELDSLKKEIETKGRRSEIFVADVSDEAQVKGFIDGAVEKLGGVDVMVANAGILKAIPLLLLPTSEWDKMFAVNARGIFLCYKYAAEQMVKQGRGGRIIGASSLAGKKGLPALTAYSGTKFAVRGLTQAAASELGQFGITVNAYAPGCVETPMMEDFIKTNGLNRDEFYATEGSKVPMKTHAQPSEIAALVSYLASKDAHFVTGQTISIDGGVNFD